VEGDQVVEVTAAKTEVEYVGEAAVAEDAD
jgi:hypothetical protein